MDDNKFTIFVTILILLIPFILVGLIVKSNIDYNREANTIKNSNMSIEEKINTKYSIFKEKVESYPKNYEMQVFVEELLNIPVDTIFNLYYEKGYKLIKITRFRRTTSNNQLEIMMTFLKTNE